MDSSGAEKTLPLAFPLPLCPGGVKAGGLPQYLPLGWVDKGGGFPANLRLMANKCRGSQETPNLCGCCKNQHINSWLHDGQKLWLKKKWASSSWQHDCRRRQPDWELCGCCHFRTSNSWLRDCQKIDFERKSNVHFLTAWLPETWTWMKTEHQIPDCMLVRNLVLAWIWSSISWLDIHEKIRGLLNTSWQLSSIQHAWNHCVSWDVWYVKQIIGLCYLASNSRPIQSRLVSLDSDTKFQNNSASRQNRTLPTVHSGQCIVVQQDHSVLWPRPPRPLGSVWWGHSTKPASQG